MDTKDKILAFNAELDGDNIVLECSDGRVLKTADYIEAIEWLLEVDTYYSVTYHIDKFADILLSILPEEISNKLDEVNKVYVDDKYKIYYIAGRQLGITFGRYEINIYSLHYYTDKPINDCKEMITLFNQVFEAYDKGFGIVPHTLSSPISVFSQKLDEIDFPRLCDLPDEAQELAKKCWQDGGWSEWRQVYKLGHWQANEVMDLDMNAAYSFIISKLPDIRHARYFKSKEMPEEYSWGMLEGNLKITKDVTPFNFVGEEHRLITTKELWLINEFELGEFEMEQGRFMQFPRYLKFPFKALMQNLYETRHNQSQMVARIAKSIMLGIGGKFAQVYEGKENEGLDLGEYFNPIYAKMITSACSTRVAEFIHRNGIAKDVIECLVDGVLVENNGINLDLGDGGMGSWRMNEPSPFIVASLLYAWGNSKHPNGEYYSDIIKRIQDNPKSPVIGKDIDLNLLTYERFFQNRPKCWKDLLEKKYESKPIAFI